MRRLTPLPEHERCHRIKGWVDKCEQGYDQCLTCGLVLNADEVETVVDPQGIAPNYKVCGLCGSHHVVTRPPVLSAEPSRVFGGGK